MKVSPLASGTALVNPNEGASADPDRLARAKAIAMGQEAPETTQKSADPQVDRAQNSIKRLKMKTQMSQNRHMQPIEAPVEPVVETEPLAEAAPPVEASDKTAINEQTPEASEDTKRLGPQFAALAKERRAVQLLKQEVLAKEKALETQATGTKSLEEYRARIKANALKVLQEEGVTYDQLTEQILASNQDNEGMLELRSQIQSLKEEMNKTLSDRDAIAERQALAQIKREADQIVAQGDDYKAIRQAGYASKVVDLIHKVWKTDGDILDTHEAAGMIEKELRLEAAKWAKILDVPAEANPSALKQQQPVQQDRPNTKIMRTLTNRDGSSSLSMNKRERAIAAMEGRLK